MAHFWLVMSVPSSRVGGVTLAEVTRSLEEGLRRCGGPGEEAVVCGGYRVLLPSLSVGGETCSLDAFLPRSIKHLQRATSPADRTPRPVPAR